MGSAGYGNHDSAPESREDGKPQGKGAEPAAGPHDKPHLTNADATPGAGALPDPSKETAQPGGDVDPGAG